MSASSDHNRLARDFVYQVASQTHTDAEMMVVVESAILATMLVLRKRHGLKPATCSAMIESAVQAATERFAAREAGR